MNSKALGKNYDKIASWWTEQMNGSDYGMKYVRKAMSYSKKNSKALDIGCGSSGRIIHEALKNDFEIVGIDVFTRFFSCRLEYRSGQLEQLDDQNELNDHNDHNESNELRKEYIWNQLKTGKSLLL